MLWWAAWQPERNAAVAGVRENCDARVMMVVYLVWCVVLL